MQLMLLFAFSINDYIINGLQNENWRNKTRVINAHLIYICLEDSCRKIHLMGYPRLTMGPVGHPSMRRWEKCNTLRVTERPTPQTKGVAHTASHLGPSTVGPRRLAFSFCSMSVKCSVPGVWSLRISALDSRTLSSFCM